MQRRPKPLTIGPTLDAILPDGSNSWMGKSDEDHTHRLRNGRLGLEDIDVPRANSSSSIIVQAAMDDGQHPHADSIKHGFCVSFIPADADSALLNHAPELPTSERRPCTSRAAAALGRGPAEPWPWGEERSCVCVCVCTMAMRHPTHGLYVAVISSLNPRPRILI